MQTMCIGVKKMPSAKITDKRIITVPFVGVDGEKNAKRWLWEYLRDNNLTAQTIEHRYREIYAEVIVASCEKEF